MSQYINFDTSHRLLAKHPFVMGFCVFISDYQYMNYYIKENREALRQRWLSLDSLAPFSQTLRFPDNKLYMHLHNSNLKKLVDQLMHLIDLPERAIERGQSMTAPQNANSLYNTKRAFHVAVGNLAKLCSIIDEAKLSDYGIYTRSRFESEFGLKWG
nr:MAG: coat protein [Ant martelli-like virus]